MIEGTPRLAKHASQIEEVQIRYCALGIVAAVAAGLAYILFFGHKLLIVPREWEELLDL